MRIYIHIQSSLLIMEARVHKLLILVGEEGEQFEGRDYKKLSEVVINEYLQDGNPEVKTYLMEFIPKVVRGVPLKAHFYAALTAAISRQHSDLAGKIIEAVLQHIQTDLNLCKFTETLNSINFLSEAMNISFFNSLTLMNLFEDILNAIEKESELPIKRGLIQVLVKALPLCACSLHEKIFHEFKKFIEKLRKISDGEDIFESIYAQFSRNSIKEYSAIGRLDADFTGLTQIQSKFKLHLDFKAMRGRDLGLPEYYKWEYHDADKAYLEYKRTEGAVVRAQIEQLVDAFESNAAILLLKLTNLLKAHKEDAFVKNFIESLIVRGLKSKNGMVNFSILVTLKNTLNSEQFTKILEETLFELFQSAEEFELSILITFSKLFSFILNNWKGEFDWARYLQGEEYFLKRNALLKLILEKITLLNDKFICPPVLQSYEPNKPVVSEEEYSTTTDLETFEHFEALLKAKTEAEVVVKSIDSERKYEIFLQALFRRTSQSQTHLNILQGRYHDILTKFSDWDWDLINKIRNFFKNSFFHRLLYLRFAIQRKALAFASYVNYVGELKNKSDIEMIWIKMELNELNSEFGKTLRQKQ